LKQKGVSESSKLFSESSQYMNGINRLNAIIVNKDLENNNKSLNDPIPKIITSDANLISFQDQNAYSILGGLPGYTIENSTYLD
jgi:hypothetical protein